ncbi:hypothetical protein [uncultured Thiodictyon sp.]|uniref:hypothetical protein n=1 Tax=uncultured Thiodictyon sp. TaxID=1846217 RepID=UPI0025DF1DFC|nr:hypothetical protein [uncultured Thiodictyon sp.]
MFVTPRLLTFASAGVLALALSQGTALAEPAAADQSAAAPVAAPAAPPAAADPQCDHMRVRMTPEERRAAREAHWKEMRARAAEHGVELPETPPWVASEQRRKAAQERFEQYRKTVEALTPEQREAAQALFGPGGRRSMPPMPEMPEMPPMPSRGGYGYGPQGGYPGYGYGYGPYQGGPMPYDEGDMEQGPAAPPAPPAPAPAAPAAE